MKIQLKIVLLVLVSSLLIEQKPIYAISEAMSEADNIKNTEAFRLALYNLDLKALQQISRPDLLGFLTKSFWSILTKLTTTDVAYSKFKGLPSEEKNVSAKEFGVSLPRKELFERAKEIMFYLISEGACLSAENALILTYWFDLEKDQSVVAEEVKAKAAKEVSSAGLPWKEEAKRLVENSEFVERVFTRREKPRDEGYLATKEREKQSHHEFFETRLELEEKENLARISAAREVKEKLKAETKR